MLKVGCAQKVNKDKVIESLSEWLHESQAEHGTKSTVVGPALGKSFTVRFAGAAGLALQSADRCFANLKTDDGDDSVGSMYNGDSCLESGADNNNGSAP